MTRLISVLLVAISAMVPHQIAFPGEQPQVRRGAGVISGRLVANDTGTPVRAARVTLVDVESRGTLFADTDDQGTFRFSFLAPGRYELAAAKPGFVGVRYGERRPGFNSIAAPIVLAAGQRLDGLVVRMPRMGSIAGVVLDEFGEPALTTRVNALRYETVSGRRTLLARGTAQVDDRGMYRIYMLPPGEYVITATPAESFTRSPSEEIALREEMLAVQAGTRSATSPVPILLAPAAAARLDAQPTLSYVTMFYPNATTLNGAGTVTLGLSEHRTGVDLVLQRLPLVRVSGTVVDLDGSIPRAEIALIGAEATIATASAGTFTWSTSLEPDGHFALTKVPAGQYTLIVRSRRSPTSAAMEPRWAMQEVSVGGSNVENLSLTLQRGVTVAGSFVAVEGGLPGFSAHASVIFTPAGESRGLAQLGGMQSAPLDAAGRFIATDLMPGKYRLEPSPMPAGWRLASAMFGGRDALDYLLEIRPGEQVPPGVLTLTTRETELAGVITDNAGDPTSAYTVIAFASDERYWMPDSRRIQSMRPAAAGRFTFKNLPPGSYWLAAFDQSEMDVTDPKALRALAAGAISVTLGDGEKKSQDVRIR